LDVVEASLSGIPLLRVVGDIDHSNSPAFDEVARKALAFNGGQVFIDLSAYPYLDSGGVRVLLSIADQVRLSGWIGVIGANDNLLRIFHLVGILDDAPFRVFADLQEASAALADKAS
jgi:anti-anti-sigma factor